MTTPPTIGITLRFWFVVLVGWIGILEQLEARVDSLPRSLERRYTVNTIDHGLLLFCGRGQPVTFCLYRLNSLVCKWHTYHPVPQIAYRSPLDLCHISSANFCSDANPYCYGNEPLPFHRRSFCSARTICETGFAHFPYGLGCLQHRLFVWRLYTHDIAALTHLGYKNTCQNRIAVWCSYTLYRFSFGFSRLVALDPHTIYFQRTGYNLKSGKA